ncbi:MAG: P44/Msp2 family outer membrane protein [Ehrlichia sp.]
MNNKGVFCIVGQVLICLASFLPIRSFSESNDDSKPVVYVAGHCKSSVSLFSNFSVKEASVNTKQLFGLRHNATSVKQGAMVNSVNFNVPYSATFQNNFANFSGAVGYISHRGPRVEVEVSHGKFDVKDLNNCIIQDACRYLTLARETTVSDSSRAVPKPQAYVVMKNNGVSTISIIFNSCYDFSMNASLKISPYACVGFGGDFIEFFDSVHTKFAYQGKLGINYPLSSKFILFVDGYYHSVIGNQFKNLSVKHVVNLDGKPNVTSATATLNIAHFGGELGLKFIF